MMKSNNPLLPSLSMKFTEFLHQHKAILVVMLLLVVFRLFALCGLGVTYSLKSDDLSYLNSGIHFANTGVITMHDTYPSAQIMPGMTILIGFLSLIFGESTLLWMALKLFWIAMGTLSAWYIYRAVSLFVPKWCAILAVLPLFRPDYIWMDNLFLTETPFILCLVAMVYYTLRMGQEKKGYKAFAWCAFFYMCALLLKANIAPYPLFAFVYLLMVKYDHKLLFKQCGILACVVLCFVIPWSIRNYIQFDAFIPLTYGSGNPTLLGTYQGYGYPADKDLDYETNVYDVVREEYASYYDEDGNVKEEYKKYISLQLDGVKASYRQKEWIKKDFEDFIYTHLVWKPQSMINSIFYWDVTLSTLPTVLQNLPYIEILFCILVAIGSLILKEYRAPILYSLAVYIGNIYIYSATYSFDRYNASVVYLRYIALGVGIVVLLKLVAQGYACVMKHGEKKDSTE